MPEWTIPFVTVLGGGGAGTIVWAFLNYRAKNQQTEADKIKAKRDDLTAAETEYRNALRQDLDELRDLYKKEIREREAEQERHAETRRDLNEAKCRIDKLEQYINEHIEPGNPGFFSSEGNDDA